jgi:hypothetical protein
VTNAPFGCVPPTRVSRMLAGACLLLAPLALAFPQASAPRIAMLPLNPISVSKADANVLTGLMETALVKTQSFDVMEQSRIAAVLDAQERSIADGTDEACAIEFGKLLAAEQIVLGTFSALGGTYFVNARIIDVASGKNIKADVVEFDALDKARDSVELLAYKLAGMTYTSAEKVEIARTFGDLFVETVPDGADICINGARRGTSPDMITRVPQGRVRVEARKGSFTAEQMVHAGPAMTKVKITLKESYGSIFIKTNLKDVTVELGDRSLGALGTGLFENVPVGTHTVTLRGDGTTWVGEVTVREGERKDRGDPARFRRDPVCPSRWCDRRDHGPDVPRGRSRFGCAVAGLGRSIQDQC